MKIQKCTFTLVVEFDGNPGLPSRVLDQSGFPWEVVFSRGDPETGDVSVGIKPLRENAPTQVSELYPYDERLGSVIERRVYDYMSSIEALDVPITQVVSHFNTGLVLHSDLERKHVKDSSVPENYVVFYALGFRWGPLPLSPMSAPAKWPYVAKSFAVDREVTLSPTMGGAYYVACGPLRIRLPWVDGVSFAHLLTTMSWEEAVTQRFPHGVRLMTPGTLDETECTG